MKLQRIALYGGTFDPVHRGHIEVAARLSELFGLDEVLFIPAHLAPHKRGAVVTPALDRYAMLALATQYDARFRISTVELNAPERPYTVDTLARLGAQLGHRARLFFVMGADSWNDITSWREWERVLALATHIVVTRPGYELKLEHVTPAVRERVVDFRGADRSQVARSLDHRDGTKIYLTDAVMMDVSATAIRRAARGEAGTDLTLFVSPPVADYIKKYRLYEDSHETRFSNAGTDSAPDGG